MLHGYIPPHRFLPYLSWTEIAALPERENTVIVLPCGAIEQHGPHLPCSVDSVIASGVMGKALEKLPAEVRAFALPPITYGKSEEHLHFPGTMTLTGTTLLSTVIEIGESVYRSGFRKLLFANGHGGQPQVLEMAARELRLRHGDFVIVPHGVSRLPSAASKQVGEQEKKLAMHAGHSETALMLALAPETVHMERAVANFPPPFPIKLLSADGRPACAWTARDFGPSGVIGDPTTATREQGEAILDTLSQCIGAGLGVGFHEPVVFLLRGTGDPAQCPHHRLHGNDEVLQVRRGMGDRVSQIARGVDVGGIEEMGMDVDRAGWQVACRKRVPVARQQGLHRCRSGADRIAPQCRRTAAAAQSAKRQASQKPHRATPACVHSPPKEMSTSNLDQLAPFKLRAFSPAGPEPSCWGINRSRRSASAY